MKKLGLYGVLLAALVVATGTYAVASSGSAGKKNFTSDTLTGYQEATPAGVSSPGSTGSFSATIDDDAQTITFELRYSGLSTPATQAHIHFGNRFTSGGVSAFLCAGGKPACPPGTTSEAVVTGTIVPADVIGPASQGISAGEFGELVAAIRAGVTYANVHSSTFPAGEVRGQIDDDDQRQP
jgi:CHRD domain-containing protein